MNPLISTPLTLLLILRAHHRKSLTPPAILLATLTALIHASPPSFTSPTITTSTTLPFTLLFTFYILGTVATRVKEAEKEKLTVKSDGGHLKGTGGRGWRQVLANSGAASLCILLGREVREVLVGRGRGMVGAWLAGKVAGNWVERFGAAGGFEELVLVGVVVNYAATTADTLSSELGILSPTPPHFILHPRTRCPPGTNGGVSLFGLLAGFLGSLTISAIAVYSPIPGMAMTTTTTTTTNKLYILAFFTAMGFLGSLVDSVLGELLQRSVVDVRTGRVVENQFGGEVLVGGNVGGEVDVDGVGKARGEPSRKVVGCGAGWLDNNGVNAVMAGSVTLLGMVGWVVLGLGVDGRV